ncbi:MAG: hypothetical protein LKE28_09280 [Sphaerochaeta sp.]|nr:hypothetical protein [Sphaerochaeta sp.]
MTGWNMDTLYGTVGSPRFRGDLSQVVTDSRRLERDIRRKSCSLVDALDRYQKILDVMESLSAFASAVRSVDTTDAFRHPRLSPMWGRPPLRWTISMSPCFPSWLLVRKKSIG